MKKLCIYHADCTDGFGAAWVVRHKYGEENVEFYAAKYGEPAPDVSGRDVIIVDFSYPLAEMQEIYDSCYYLTVLDHHKTALETLGHLEADGALANRHIEFDMERSGAMMAWEHYFNWPAPDLICHVQDRDLWRFKLPGTKEIMTAVFAAEMTFEAWDTMMEPDMVDTLLTQGTAMMQKGEQDIKNVLSGPAGPKSTAVLLNMPAT